MSIFFGIQWLIFSICDCIKKIQFSLISFGGSSVIGLGCTSNLFYVITKKNKNLINNFRNVNYLFIINRMIEKYHNKLIYNYEILKMSAFF